MVEDTQKRYADDITLQELVRLRVENERLRKALEEKVTAQLLEYIEDMRRNFSENARLREALQKIANAIQSDWFSMREIARSALQQKESE